MKASVLTSGSSGNSIVVQCNGMYFLVEAGISPRAASGLLHKVHDLRLANIRGVLISHNHIDHYRYICDYERRGIRGGIGPSGVSVLDGFVDCRAFAVPHDASSGTYGFHITERETNAALCIISDAGCFNKAMIDAINDADVVLIGANYCEELMSDSLRKDKDRVTSSTGHLSNEDIATMIRHQWNGRAHTFALMHLSKDHNTPERATETVCAALHDRDKESSVSVVVSVANVPTPLIAVNP